MTPAKLIYALPAMFWCCLFSPALANALDRTIETVRPQIATDRIVEGKEFEVQYRFIRNDMSPPRIELAAVPSRIERIGEPQTTMEQQVGQAGAGKIVATVHLRYLAKQAGWVVLPGARFQFADIALQADPYPVGIGLAAKPDQVPADLGWKVPAGPVYVGQSVPVTLEMRMARTLVVPKSFVTPTMTGALMEEIGAIGSSTSSTIADQLFYKVPIASYMVTPTSAGSLSLPSVPLVFDGFSVSPAPATMLVVSTTEGLGTGAIGSLYLFLVSDTREPLQGQPFTIAIRIEGSGNLKYLKMPVLPLDQVSVLKTEEKTRIVPFEGGFRGTRELLVQVMPKAVGPATIKLDPYPVMNPKTGAVSALEVAPLVFSVRASVQAPRNQRDDVFQLPSSHALQAMDQSMNLPLSVFIAAFCPGFFVLGFTLFRKKWRAVWIVALIVSVSGTTVWTALDLSAQSRREQQSRERIAQLKQELSSGRFELAGKLSQDLVRVLPDSPLVWYGLSTQAFYAKKDSQALLALEKAVSLLPTDGFLVSTLHRLSSLKAIESVQPPLPLSWKMVLPLSALLFLAGALLVVIVQKHKSTSLFTLGLSVILISLSGFGLVCRTTTWLREPIAAIREGGATIRRIPEPDAQPWLLIPEGTSVRIRSYQSGYTLIKTAYGVEGWALSTDVYDNPDKIWSLGSR